MTRKIDILFFHYQPKQFLDAFGYCFGLLPKEFELQEFAKPQLALPSLAARLMVLQYLQSLGLSPQPWQYLPHGKPKPQSGIYFNISHCKDAVAVAFYDAEVGIDIERMRKVNHQSFGRVFTAEELNYIGNSDERFFELWTRKEALIKADGGGFSLPVNEIDSLQQPTKIGQRLWHWRPVALQGLHAHLAFEQPDALINLIPFQPPY